TEVTSRRRGIVTGAARGLRVCDLVPKRPTRRFRLRCDDVEARRHFLKLANPGHMLQLGTLRREGCRAQHGARALETMCAGEDRRLIFPRGRIAELREHQRQAIEERRHDLPERCRVAEILAQSVQYVAIDALVTWRRRITHLLSRQRADLSERAPELLEPDRLRQIVIHASGEAALPIPFHSLRAHRDAARPLSTRPAGTSRATRLGPVPPRRLP